MVPKRIVPLFALLVLLLALSPSASRSIAAQAFQLEDFNILLGRPTDHSVTANVIPAQGGHISFEYGTGSGVYSDQTSAIECTADEPVEVVIEGLASSTRYYYRLRFRETDTSPWTAGGEHSFHTQRSPGSTFIFTMVADSHLGQYGGATVSQRALYEQTLLNIDADHPDFHLDLGDAFPMDPSPLGSGMTEGEAETAYLFQRPYLGLIGHSVPFYLAVGNHENEEGWNFDDVFAPPDQSLALVGLKYRKLYYPNPVPDDFYTGNDDPLPEPIGGDALREDYYAWEWGDALFVVLDPFHYSMTWPAEGDTYGGEGMDGEAQGDRWDWTLGLEQYLWFKDTLENTDATFKFVFAHQVTGGVIPYGRGGVAAAPYFEWGGLNWDGTPGFATERPGWETPIHQLMVENDVDVFFHGHDHFYAKEELDGIVYQECPKPDDDSYGMGFYSTNPGWYPTGVLLSNSGHIRVTVSPDEVAVDYVRAHLPGDGANGEVAHSYTIPADVPATHDLTMAVDPAEGGTTDPLVGVHPYPEDQVVPVAATAAAGYVFDYWEGDVADPDSASTTVTIDEDRTVTAHFALAPGLLGDVNGNDAANSTDALIILSCDVGINTSQFCPMKCGDVNGDGLINSTDALIILSSDVGMVVPYPVGEPGCPSSATACPGCTP